MRRLFSYIVGLVSFGRYHMVESAAEAAEAGDCWLEEGRDGQPTLYVVESAERDERGNLVLETARLQSPENSARFVGWAVLAAIVIAQIAGLWLVLS